MKCVAGHQPNLYPYGGFFAKADAADLFVMVDVTQYVRKEFHNRNRVMLLDGEPHWLTLPVLHHGRFGQRICDVEIDPSKNWRKTHLRTLELNYAGAPYFALYYPEIEALINSREWEKLADFSVAFIRLCWQLLNLKTPLLLASEENIDGKASELIAAICRHCGADCYLHGRHSRDYVDFTYLENCGIHSRIQDFQPLPYPGREDAFTPNMSIIDVLFNCGPGTLDYLRLCNKIED